MVQGSPGRWASHWARRDDPIMAEHATDRPGWQEALRRPAALALLAILLLLG